jgi:hypothetical protein
MEQLLPSLSKTGFGFGYDLPDPPQGSGLPPIVYIHRHGPVHGSPGAKGLIHVKPTSVFPEKC